MWQLQIRAGYTLRDLQPSQKKDNHRERHVAISLVCWVENKRPSFVCETSSGKAVVTVLQATTVGWLSHSVAAAPTYVSKAADDVLFWYDDVSLCTLHTVQFAFSSHELHTADFQYFTFTLVEWSSLWTLHTVYPAWGTGNGRDGKQSGTDLRRWLTEVAT